MKNLLLRLLSIKANEWEAVWYFFFVMLVFAFGSSIARSIGMTLLIEHLGGEILPQMFIMIDLTAMVSLIAYAHFTKTYNGLQILVFLLICGSLFAILARFLFFLPYAWVYGFFFVGFFLIYILISIHVGSVVAAYFNTVQLKRVTGVINAGLPIGGALGGAALIILLQSYPEPQWMIAMMALAYWVAFLILRKIRYKLTPVRTGQERKSTSTPIQQLQRAFVFIINSKLMIYMSIGLMLFVIASKLLEYQYQALIYPSEFPLPQDRAAFFATYEIFGNLAWLFLQLLVTSRLIMKLGVGASNLLHPILMFLVSIGLLFRFGFVAGVIAQFVNQEMRGALRTPANNLLFNAVPPNMWATTKAFINGIVFPISTLIASIMLMLIKDNLGEAEQIFMLPLLALGFSAVAILVALPQWAAYNEGVFGLLNRNLFSNHKTKVGKLDSLNKMVEDKLHSKQSQEVVAALEMIRVVKLRGFVHQVGNLITHSDNPKIKQHCIDALAAMPPSDALTRHLLTALKNERSPTMLATILRILSKQSLAKTDVCQKVEKYLLHPSPLVFAETCICLYNSASYPHKSALEERLLIRLKYPQLRRFDLYLNALGEVKNPAYSALVIPYLEHENTQIRLAAFQAHISMLKGQLDFYQQNFLDALNSPDKDMKIAALHALKECQAPSDWLPIIQLLGANERNVVKESKELLHLHLNRAKPALIERLFQADISVTERFEVLSLIYPQLSEEQRKQLQHKADLALDDFIRHTALLMLYRQLEPEHIAKPLVEKILQEIADTQLYTLLTMLTYLAHENREFYLRVSRGLLSENKANQGNALEVLSNAREKYLVARILYYYEERPNDIEQLQHIYTELFNQELQLDAENYRQSLLDIEHALLRAALHYTEHKQVNHWQLLYEKEETRELLGVVN